MKKTTHKLSKMQRKVRSQRKKWTKIKQFAVVQDNLVRNAIAKDKKPPERRVKRKLNPTQLFERRQQKLKRTQPTVMATKEEVPSLPSLPSLPPETAEANDEI